MYLRENFVLYSDGFLRYFDCDVSSVCRVHRIFTKILHSPLDSANNTCYSTIRTKEEGNRERQRNKKAFPLWFDLSSKKETGKQQLRF